MLGLSTLGALPLFTLGALILGMFTLPVPTLGAFTERLGAAIEGADGAIGAGISRVGIFIPLDAFPFGPMMLISGVLISGAFTDTEGAEADTLGALGGSADESIVNGQRLI
jgi:hypothetical protein